MLESFPKTINKSVQVVSNQDQIKMSLNVKSVVAMNFMRPKLLKVFIRNIIRFVMQKMALLSKIKSHFDPVNYFKEIPQYKVAIIERKDPIVQLEASKSSFKDLFSDLLNETKGFKYRINVKVLLKKYKLNGEIEFALVYFNSLTKTVINHRF